MWDDYMGWDWYAMRQWAFFACMFLFLASVIGMTEGYAWHHPASYIFAIIITLVTICIIFKL